MLIVREMCSLLCSTGLMTPLYQIIFLQMLRSNATFSTLFYSFVYFSFCLGTIDIWGLDYSLFGAKLLAGVGVRGCPGHYRIFSSVPDLYPPNASSTPSLSCNDQKCHQILPNVFEGQSCSSLRTLVYFYPSTSLF